MTALCIDSITDAGDAPEQYDWLGGDWVTLFSRAWCGTLETVASTIDPKRSLEFAAACARTWTSGC